MFTTALHLSLSSTTSKSSSCPPPHHTSWTPILILSSHLRLGFPRGLSPSGLPTKTLSVPLLSLIRSTYPVHLSLLYQFLYYMRLALPRSILLKFNTCYTNVYFTTCRIANGKIFVHFVSGDAGSVCMFSEQIRTLNAEGKYITVFVLSSSLSRGSLHTCVISDIPRFSSTKSNRFTLPLTSADSQSATVTACYDVAHAHAHCSL